MHVLLTTCARAWHTKFMLSSYLPGCYIYIHIYTHTHTYIHICCQSQLVHVNNTPNSCGLLTFHVAATILRAGFWSNSSGSYSVLSFSLGWTTCQCLMHVVRCYSFVIPPCTLVIFRFNFSLDFTTSPRLTHVVRCCVFCIPVFMVVMLPGASASLGWTT